MFQKVMTRTGKNASVQSGQLCNLNSGSWFFEDSIASSKIQLLILILLQMDNSSNDGFANSEGGGQEGQRNDYSTFLAHGYSLLLQWLYDKDRSNERKGSDIQTDISQHNWGNSVQASHQILSQFLKNLQAVSKSRHSNNKVIIPHPNNWGNRNKDPESSKSQSDFSAFYHYMEELEVGGQQSVLQELKLHLASKMEQIVGKKQQVIKPPEAKSVSQQFSLFKAEISRIQMLFYQSLTEEQKNICDLFGEKKNMKGDNQPQPEGKEEKQQEVKPARSKYQLFQRYWGIIRQKLTEVNTITEEKVKKYKLQLIQTLDQPQLDRALGVIYGALIGDALGAYCPSQYSLSDQTVDEAMQMNGDGPFGLAAGQFTDDSELAAHLLQGLSSFKQSRPLEEQESRLVCQLGLQYMQWYNSGPFDSGDTIRHGIKAMCKYKEQLREHAQGEKEPKFLEKMLGEISNTNKNSMGSGSLMRISPFPFFFSLSGINPRLHDQFIKDEIRLTHPNEILAAAGVFWVDLLTTLIKRDDDSKETFCSIFDSTMTAHLICQQQLGPWFDEAMKLKQQAMSGATNMGFAKIPFSYGLRILNYLAQGQETKVDEGLYMEWMKWIIKRAGATDTNGAIGGGLMGSIVGFWGLPERYVARTLKTVTDHRLFKIIDEEEQPQPPSKSKNSTRSSFYEPCNVLLAALDLMPRLKLYRDYFNQQE